jgi:hypothetical protein
MKIPALLLGLNIIIRDQVRPRTRAQRFPSKFRNEMCAVSLTAPALLQRHCHTVRYCSFVDVSYIVNESIRPDLIVGRNKAHRDAPRVTDAFICGNVMCRVPQERNVSTSGYVSRPMTIALDYTRRKTILAVSLLGRGAPRHSALIYARITRRAAAAAAAGRAGRGGRGR